jgi:hypothetical protein
LSSDVLCYAIHETHPILRQRKDAHTNSLITALWARAPSVEL